MQVLSDLDLSLTGVLILDSLLILIVLSYFREILPPFVQSLLEPVFSLPSLLASLVSSIAISASALAASLYSDYAFLGYGGLQLSTLGLAVFSLGALPFLGYRILTAESTSGMLSQPKMLQNIRSFGIGHLQ